MRSPEDEAASFCETCLDAIAPVVWHGCQRCGQVLPQERQARAHCAACQRSKLHFDRVVPLGAYRSALRGLILRMKSPRHDALSLSVGRLLAERRQAELEEIAADFILPIPMHWWRRWTRGKNNAGVLADCLGASLGTQVEQRILSRRRNTPPQARLAPARRFDNVRGAFAIGRSASRIRDAKILLVDDVLTTGATCSEAAKVLKEAGAALVAVAVVARAEPHRA